MEKEPLLWEPKRQKRHGCLRAFGIIVFITAVAFTAFLLNSNKSNSLGSHLTRRSSRPSSASNSWPFQEWIADKVQERLDDIELHVHSMDVVEPRSDSYLLIIRVILRGMRDIPLIHPKVRPFTGLLALTDMPFKAFARINFPETSSNIDRLELQQRIKVHDNQAFSRFGAWLLANETLRVSLIAPVTVQVAFLRYNGTFRKIIDIKGFNGLRGTKLLDQTVSITPDERGNNFYGVVQIPNPSTVKTLEIGNATFTNLFRGQAIGSSYIDDLVLREGPNNFNMRAHVDQGPVTSALFERPYCETGIIPISIRADSVINAGSQISYLANALASSEHVINVDMGAALRKLEPDAKLKCL